MLGEEVGHANKSRFDMSDANGKVAYAIEKHYKRTAAEGDCAV